MTVNVIHRHARNAVRIRKGLCKIHTDKNSTKGAMVVKVAAMLGIDPKHIYCIGDNRNDLSMLALSAIPFAPANCAPEVKEWGAHILCHTDDHAIAQAIALLDSIY